MAQTPDEKTYVETPFIEQLKAMGWKHIEGDIDVPYLTERRKIFYGKRRPVPKSNGKRFKSEEYLTSEIILFPI